MMEKTEMKGEAFKGTKLLSLPLIIKRTNTAIFFSSLLVHWSSIALKIRTLSLLKH